MKYNSEAVLRITALWACSEAFLGGLLHAIKLPMSGLLLATMASICITLISILSNKRGAVLKATLVVIAIKFALSPHTPVAAYFAVGIQGLAGELFFLSKKRVEISAFLLSVFSLMYSALQRLIIMIILFGVGFYHALNEFLNKTTQTFIKGHADYVGYLVALYLLIYLIVGILAGLLNIRIVRYVKADKKPEFIERIALTESDDSELPKRLKKRGYKYIIPLAIFSVLLLAATYMPQWRDMLFRNQILLIIVRSVLITLVWVFALSPVIKTILKNTLEKKGIMEGAYFKNVIGLLPEIRALVSKSWRASHSPNKFIQVKKFIVTCFLLVIFYE